MRTDLLSSSPLPADDRAPAPLSVVINPGSGDNDAQQTRELLARVFQEAGRPHHFVPVGSPQQLKEAGRDAQAAASALARGRVEAVQVGEVNGRLFLVNASLGLYPQLLQDREAFKSQLGRYRWVAMLSGLVTLFEWRRRMTLEIELDGQCTLLVTPTLFVGNNRLQLERIGIEAAFTDRVGDGRLAAIVLKPVGNWQMLGLVLRGAIGRLGEAQQVQSFAFRTLTVRVRRMRRMKVAVDGEVGVMAPPLRLSVSATPLQLLLPQPQDRVDVQ